MKARIFDIKRFAVHDGDGIRTTLFFKGCPLTCVWCHNPEGLDFKPQLAFYKNKCVLCGECVNICPQNAHSLKNCLHTFERKKCTSCGKCADACLAGALTVYGKDVTVEELMPLLLADKNFYKTSGGGVTLSGGECLLQPDFCAELLKRLRAENIHTAIDTCGFVPKEAIDRIMPYTDLFLYDIKAIDEDVHIKCTGRTNQLILDNLKYIDQCGKSIEVRIPYVPQWNDNQIEKIAAFLGGIKNTTKVRVLPYHHFAGFKYLSLDMINTLPERLPTQYELQEAMNLFKKQGIALAN